MAPVTPASSGGMPCFLFNSLTHRSTLCPASVLCPLAFLSYFDSLTLKNTIASTISLLRDAHSWISASSSFLDIWPFLFIDGTGNFGLVASLFLQNQPSISKKLTYVSSRSVLLLYHIASALDFILRGQLAKPQGFVTFAVSFAWFLNFSYS